jgi:hypothetical protein
VYLVGEFREKAEAAAAIRSLRAAGIGPGDLDLFSEEPVEFPRSVLSRPSRMSLAAVAGAAAFGTLATAFMYYAQHDYPLDTGGMPLFSFWATGVITYEMTMLGAIAATFAWFLWESGLLRRRDRTAPVPVVDPGSMCLRVRCVAGEAGLASDALRRAGAIHIERSGEA